MFNTLESKKLLLPKNCSWIFKYISIMYLKSCFFFMSFLLFLNVVISDINVAL